MDTRVTDKAEFVTLTDRHGNLNLADWESILVTDEEESAIERLLDSMFDEVTFVARRKSDGAVGILIEASEFPHAGSDDSPEEVVEAWGGGTVNGKPVSVSDLPSLDDVTTELSMAAREVAAAYPGLDVAVTHGPDVTGGRAVIRAFVPEGSEHAPAVEAIARRLMGEAPEASPSP